MVDVKAKLWLEKGSRFILGEGRAELLRRVGETGSIAKAAKIMGMSYSHAWSELRDISEALGRPVVETERGGRAGGRSSLTDAGRKVLDLFDKEKERMDRHLAESNR